MGANQSGHSPTNFRESQVIMGVGPSARGATSSSNRPELSRTGVIRNSINVRRSSIKLSEDGKSVTLRFDSSINSKFRIYFKCNEYLNEKKFPILASDTDVVESEAFSPGLDQKLAIPLPEGGVGEYDESLKIFPLVIETVPPEGAETASQLTYIGFRNGRAVAVKQKLRYGDRGYELHEIFGIEKAEDKSPVSSGDYDDMNGTDCVICLTNARDTTIIPCLHLCLCSQCAQVLSLNTRKCPVCRTPATGLLQIDRDLPPPSPISTSKAVKISD